MEAQGKIRRAVKGSNLKARAITTKPNRLQEKRRKLKRSHRPCRVSYRALRLTISTK